MSSTSPVLGLPYLQPSQAQKHVTHNEALRILDAVTQLSVLDGGLSDPPAEPAEGDRYIVAPPGSGAWAGQDRAVAVFVDGTWQFFAPQAGWRADVTPTGEVLRFDGADWAPLPGIDTVETLGVNATADTTNRLAVAAGATLLNHDGAGHQLKLNKAAEGDTASLLFQTGFSGRAEMGTTGSDDFAVKVSDDGTTFRDALVAEAGTGALRMPQGQCYFEDVFILNDDVYVFDIPFSNPARILMWLSVNITGRFYLFSITGSLSGATNFGAMFVNPPGSLNFLTGALGGTTGPDGTINLSIDTTGPVPRMCIENRLGSNRFFTLATLGK